ncbi:GNAT family N-acetyltransferase [Lapidilactobacillus wuchangensis]|uniref:GNAT family N-acetyltransferase n=1 Tax=Lapidilactobacillus wuchangensis TaxID=2486001 RepID=UPI000F7AE663|nr:GNAT family N-acetyltransferase [Lapidilactobacillus wuchangensis]
MTTPVLKQVQLADLTTLQQISRETFADTFGSENSASDLAEYLETAYSNEQLTSELANPESAFYFVQLADQVAGYLKVNWGQAQSEKLGATGFEIERIYIRPQFKRHGLGRLLYQHAVDQAEQADKEFIWLGVWERNYPAQAFYKKLGFYQVGQHTFTLGEDPQTDLLMRRDLNNH